MENKKYKYLVALSFSKAQRVYAERVSNELNRLEVPHFYDLDEQEHLWGKDLTRYLDKVYRESSKYLVPFISKEYAETVWPNIELSAALDRNMNDIRPDYQRYILPLYFDDIRIDGIPKSIAYYDANRITPEALANAIYKKLRSSDDVPQSAGSSSRLLNRLDDPAGKFDNAQSHQVETLNISYLTRLRTVCSGDTPSHVVVVYGERGIGKRSCISKILSEFGDRAIYHIQPFYENSYKYDGIIRSLNLDANALRSQNDLDFETDIRRKIISICTKSSSIFYVEHFHEFDEESRTFLFELASTLIARYHYVDVCVVIEFDSDSAPNLIEPFYELPSTRTDFIQFSRLSAEEMKKSFYNCCGSINISEENLDYILRSSLGNIMYLNIIINYLQGAGYICKTEEGLTCTCLPDGVLADVLRKYLLQRYERLDEVLKELLSKSSIVGSIFNANLLEIPFQIIDAAEKLKNIEKISNLIEHRTDQTYIFETNDVYRLIQNTISVEQQREWHSILAHYFQKILNRESKRKNALTVERAISLIYPIAKHFYYAADYQAALPYFFQLVSQYSKLCDYTNEMKAVKDIQFILERIELDESELDTMETNVLIAEADCRKGVGQYAEAYELYDKVLSYVDDTAYSQLLIDITYDKAYCLYMAGRVMEAREILLFVCGQFNLQHEHQEDYIRIISLLASICDSTNDPMTQKRLYIEALTYYKENYCKTRYYELLRMASMVFDEVIAFDMEKEAEKYFRSSHSIRMLAETLHNLATTELYLMKTEEILLHLDECISLFDSFGSKAVHYPLNTKGIVHAVVKQDYGLAIDVFDSALSVSTEPYSEIAIRTNLVQCFIQLGQFDEALKQIQMVDDLIDQEPCGIVPVYDTFRILNRAVYHFHLNEYKKSEEYLKQLNKQKNIEDRHKFIVKFLQYKLKKAQGMKARNTAGSAPYPIYQNWMEKGLFFATLRFFE